MWAAKGGHLDTVKLLQEHGANPRLLTPSGLSPGELALLWRHGECAAYIENCDRSNTAVDDVTLVTSIGGSLSRHADKRLDKDWIREKIRDGHFLMMHRSLPVVFRRKSGTKKRSTNLLLKPRTEISGLVKEDDQENVIFLGRREDGKYTFAVDISDVSTEADIPRILDCPEAEILSLYPGFFKLDPEDRALAGFARSLMDWHFRYKFCPTCGSRTKTKAAGHKRVCLNDQCATNRGTQTISCDGTLKDTSVYVLT